VDEHTKSVSVCVCIKSEAREKFQKILYSDVITGMTFMKRSENYEHKKRFTIVNFFASLSLSSHFVAAWRKKKRTTERKKMMNAS
jgi:hypothetical protein